jgi:hypothetical protein
MIAPMAIETITFLRVELNEAFFLGKSSQWSRAKLPASWIFHADYPQGYILSLTSFLRATTAPAHIQDKNPNSSPPVRS